MVTIHNSSWLAFFSGFYSFLFASLSFFVLLLFFLAYSVSSHFISLSSCVCNFFPFLDVVDDVRFYFFVSCDYG